MWRRDDVGSVRTERRTSLGRYSSRWLCCAKVSAEGDQRATKGRPKGGPPKCAKGQGPEGEPLVPAPSRCGSMHIEEHRILDTWEP
jgi:hypothetical protein